jgi:serine/threonine protein kinase
VGQVFKKRYEIKRKLKSGGFASVYSAKDLEQKGRYVAVKVMEAKSKFYAEIEFNMYEKIKENNYTFGFVKVCLIS